MIKLKDIAELPVAESAENVSFVVHEDGVAKQVPYVEVFKSDIEWVEFGTQEGAKFAVVGSSLFKNKDFEEMKKVPGQYTSYGALYDLLMYCDLVIRRNRGYGAMVNLSSYAPRIVNSLKALYDAGYINDAAKSGFIFLQKEEELDNPNLWSHFRITYQKSKTKLEVRNDLDISFGFELNSETGAIVSDFAGITDKELVRSDKPADAKATGDALKALEERVESVSWNDLKDKPFYEGTETYTILENQELNDTGDDFQIQCWPDRAFESGDEVTITFSDHMDGGEDVTYTSEVFDDGSIYYTECPYGRSYTVIFDPRTGGFEAHCFKHRKVTVVVTHRDIKKIEPKYLPDNIGGGGEKTYYIQCSSNWEITTSEGLYDALIDIVFNKHEAINLKVVLWDARDNKSVSIIEPTGYFNYGRSITIEGDFKYNIYSFNIDEDGSCSAYDGG